MESHEPTPSPTSGESAYAPTARTTLKRMPARADYRHDTVHAILDEAFVAHVAFAVDGRAVVIPTAFARIGDRFYLHGSPGNRMLRALASGVEACINVMLVDALVVARSAFHHSVNYRSVVIFGRAEEVTDPREKLAALRATVEHVVPGRWPYTRPPSETELARTKVVALDINEASAKLRSGYPLDDEPDYELPFWAGVIPLRTVPGAPDPCPRLPATIEAPEHAVRYRRPGW